MRRWIAAVVLSSAMIAMDATHTRAQLAIGVRGGLNVSTIAWSPTPLGDGVDGLTRRKAFSGGLVFAAEGPGPLRFRAEGLYSGKGFSTRDSPTESRHLAVDYLEVPLLVGLTLAGGDKLRPELYAGPWAAWEVDCDAELRTVSASLSFECDEIPDDPVLRKTTDFGWVAGISLMVADLGPLQGLIDLRYSASLRNVDAAPEIDNVRAKHRAYSAAAGLLIPIGR
jgi:hypothetical protein